jgi:hypothetical protein
MAKGPKPKPIDWKQVEFAMMSSECQYEIAASQGVDRDTLRRRFQEEYGVDYTTYSAQMHKKGNILLRQAQMKSALKGSSTMQLWLGKIRLGQAEPDGSSRESPKQDEINIQHENMKLKNLLAQHGIPLDDNKPETEQELFGSDA